MPYKKSYRKKKPYSSSLAKHSSARMSWELAKRAAHQVVKLYVNTEKKFNDTAFVTTVSSTASIFTIADLVQGLTAITRVGDQVRWVNMMYNMTIKMHASATETNLRLMLILDRQPNNAVATVAQVLETSSVTGLREINTGKRFYVYHDKVFSMSSAGETALSEQYYRKINVKTEFNANAGTVADISTNNIFFLLISDEATNVPSVNLQIRMRYIDN